MDLLNSFINKNLDDFVKSFAGSLVPEVGSVDGSSSSSESSSSTSSDSEENLKEQEHYALETEIPDKRETPLLSPQRSIFSPHSFVAGHSVLESVCSETNALSTLLDDDELEILLAADELTDDSSMSACVEEATLETDRMRGEYGRRNFNLSMDILPTVSIENSGDEHTDCDTEHLNKGREKDTESKEHSALIAETEADTTATTLMDDEWHDLPNVVKYDELRELPTLTNDDPFLRSIAKEIELLDEELSSMGILPGKPSTPIPVGSPTKRTPDESDIDEEEERLDKLLSAVQNQPKEQCSENQEPKAKHQDTNCDAEEEEDESEIEIIHDQLSLLRKSLVEKKKSVSAAVSEHGEEHTSEQKDRDTHQDSPQQSQNISSPTRVTRTINVCDSIGSFATLKHKDAFFDPLTSPVRESPVRIIHESPVRLQSGSNQELGQSDQQQRSEHQTPNANSGNSKHHQRYNRVADFSKAQHHENASKIQQQWKKFQFKSILVKTFNRHLRQAQHNRLPVTVTGLISSTTHEIVDHAEKLFEAVHQIDQNLTAKSGADQQDVGGITIGNFSYAQLHFYGSPALDWSSVYSKVESIVLRNLLHSHRNIVANIADSQRILDDVVQSGSDSLADRTLIEQLTTQLSKLKAQVYRSCQNNAQCNLPPLRLFQHNAGIYRSERTPSRATESVDSVKMASNAPSSGSSSKPPELDTIRNQLSLLRKSFSQRRRNVGKMRTIRSSPKLSATLRSSIDEVNFQVESLCSQRQQNRNVNSYASANHFVDDPSASSTRVFTFVGDNASLNSSYAQRPMTAPSTCVLSRGGSHHGMSASGSGSPTSSRHIKKPFLKRKNSRTLRPQKVDWSHVKPKTVSRLSDDVRAQRTANVHKPRHKPSAPNWKKKAQPRVDCSWSADRFGMSLSSTNYRSSARPKTRDPRAKRRRNEFVDSYSNTQANANNRRRSVVQPSHYRCAQQQHRVSNKQSDDEFLYYIKKGNQVGKISRDSAQAQLHDGSGNLVLAKPRGRGRNRERRAREEDVRVVGIEVVSKNHDGDECERYIEEQNSTDAEMHVDNQLMELQQTFAAIEKAMKQRRQQSA